MNKEENFRDKFQYISRNMKNVLEIAPLIKLGQANYKYLIGILSSLTDDIKENYPNNVRLARFFQNLLNCKEEFVEQIGIDGNAFTAIIGKMMDNVDKVDDILKKDSDRKHRNTK